MTDTYIQNLNVIYRSKKGILGKNEVVHAVNNLSLEIKSGEILAIAGESGCGKSTLAKAIIGLEDIESGEIFFGNKKIQTMNKSEMRNFRKNIQMIFQNPFASLNPKMKIVDILAEPLEINTNLTKMEIHNKILEMLDKVGLDKYCLNKYPHEFSGGQRQRIAIARALILDPQLVLADEPVSALDVSIQAQIINLLKDLKEKYNFTFLFISHDLSVIKYLSDRVGIMYLGEIVELGKSDEVFYSPKHPYTKALLSAVPKIIETGEEKIELIGDLPSPANLPLGCKFHTRCPYCMPVCKECLPDETYVSNSHYVKCFLYSKKNNI